ncbi:hypothetical protein ET495_10310 [Xylanimonas allomyrinae]|uniref:Alternate-type signal peptide domain-containing protein n=1 Tax=Xylanimonas allomyrinae TaxID=2509459 RepID=A0A4P6ELM0_9MICO|nr:hypothetical protein [Xylanimonas allomyrinae]QAY63574.1 hypothetical protein ET495_10310 [Xylanimonas allomyrinae]
MKKNTRIRASLAGLAVLGLGAAATAAAWTTEATFEGSARTADFTVTGTLSGTLIPGSSQTLYVAGVQTTGAESTYAVADLVFDAATVSLHLEEPDADAWDFGSAEIDGVTFTDEGWRWRVDLTLTDAGLAELNTFGAGREFENSILSIEASLKSTT